MNPTFRSLFAVIDGLLLFLALEGLFSVISVLGLGRSFDTPTPGFLTTYLLYALLAAGAGGFVAGKVARRHPVIHGLAMAVLLLPLVIFNLHKGAGSQHGVFVYALNLFTPIAAIVGSALNREPFDRATASRSTPNRA